MIDHYLLYVTLAFTIVAIPGPAVVLTIKNSLNFGCKAAAVNICGNFIAMVILASLSAVGLGAVILASSTLFFTLKVAGCGYLIFLGIKAWQAAPMKVGMGDVVQAKREAIDFSCLATFKEGFFVGIANPKAIAFFTALFPQFIDPAHSFIPQFITLILTIEGISFLVLMLYAMLSSLTALYLTRRRPMAVFNKLTALSFIGFGVALLADH